jgi:hypothetical protein
MFIINFTLLTFLFISDLYTDDISFVFEFGFHVIAAVVLFIRYKGSFCFRNKTNIIRNLTK